MNEIVETVAEEAPEIVKKSIPYIEKIKWAAVGSAATLGIQYVVKKLPPIKGKLFGKKKSTVIHADFKQAE